MNANLCGVPSARKHSGSRQQGTAMGLSAIGLMLTLALGIVVGPRATDAQQPGKIPRLGILRLQSYHSRIPSKKLPHPYQMDVV